MNEIKSILITGSTDGIGKMVASRLAQDGHNILLHGRSLEKLNSTIDEIKENSGNSNIQGFKADFSNMQEVRNMGNKIKNTFSKIDILINNAGIYNSVKSHNDNGIDLRFAINYFAPYVLTNSLLDLLQKSDKPCILNLSSAAQSQVSIKALQGAETLSERETYAQSKLALTMWSFALSAQEPHINIIAVNPGSLLNTKLVQEAFGTHRLPADTGANILYNLAISKGKNAQGKKYYDNDRGSFAQAHPDAYENHKVDQLMEETRKILMKI